MNLRFRLVSIIIILLFNLSIENTTSQVISNKYELTALDGYFENARQDWKIPGMAIAIVKNDEIILAKGYGVKDIRTNEPVDENTIFGIASNTKAFTAAAVMKLVEQGKINLEDKVKDYLPYFELYDSYVSNNMTIRDLLCHRSGLATFSGDLIWYASSYDRNEVIKRAKYIKPAYGFRYKFGYSNIMFLAAGQIVTEVSGMTWDNFIKQFLFDPLKMTHSNTSITENKNLENIATPHFVENDNTTPLQLTNWDNMAPAGGINSSVMDMSNWLIMQLNNGKFNNQIILEESSVNETRTPQMLNTTNRFDSTMHFRAYGLGFDLFDYHGYLIINHSGGLDGMISHVAIIPEMNMGMVVLTNSNNYLPSALMYKTIDYFLNNTERDWSAEFLNYQEKYNEFKANKREEEEKERLRNTNPTLPIIDYTGTYGGPMYGNAKVTIVENHLEIEFIPTPTLSCVLSHWQNDTFELTFKNNPSLPNGKVEFIIGENGRPIEFKVDVPNPDFDFTELEFKRIGN